MLLVLHQFLSWYTYIYIKPEMVSFRLAYNGDNFVKNRTPRKRNENRTLVFVINRKYSLIFADVSKKV